MKLLIFGAPGAGKGTQAKLICKHLNIEHISTGELMRKEVSLGTDLGKELDEIMSAGKYVPDNTTIELLKKKLTKDVLKQGFLLDGFPRTMEQVIKLEQIIGDIDKAIELEIDEKIIIDRLSKRRVCNSCGAIFNSNEVGIETGSNCKKCLSGVLEQRKDDTEQAIKVRLDIYSSATKPLIKFYEDKNKIVKINGTGTVEEVKARVLSKLEV